MTSHGIIRRQTEPHVDTWAMWHGIVLCHKILSVASQSSYGVTQTDNTSHSIALHRIASHGPRLRLWRICRFTPDESYFCSGQKKTFWHCLKLFSRWPLLKARPQKKRRMREFESLERFYDSSGARLFVRLTEKSSPKTWLVKMRETVALHCSKTFETRL